MQEKTEITLKVENLEGIKDVITEAVLEALNLHQAPKEEVRYYTRAEVANLFRVSKQTITNWKKAGLIQGTGIGSNLRFSEKDINNAKTRKNTK